MNSKQWEAKIESLREEMESAQEQYERAVAVESGLVLGKTIVKDERDNLFRVSSVRKLSEFINVSGHKQLKAGKYSGRERYVGILGHGLEIV